MRSVDGLPAAEQDANVDDGWRPVLRALIEAILAFEHPAFPAIGIDHVERRLIACYPLAGAHGAQLRAGFAAFDRAFAAEVGAGARFANAPLEARRATLRRWARSDEPERRRFYASVKRLVLIPAYSLPELRRAIGCHAEPEPGSESESE
jgi:hypothetical protein